MKTKITLLCLLIVASFTSKGQTYVTIPDTTFVSWLQNNYPSCMNGNQMDITCANIQNETYAYISGGMPISDLTGIEYFINLQNLNCSVNQLTTLPALPNSLTYIDCHGNQIASLPTLPGSLQTLSCDYNLLSSLPALPNSLTTLYCDHNLLTSLPALPNSLITLYCNNNQLTNLPTLPNSFQNLYCDYNHLTSLPSFPNFLQTLDCSYNQLTNFPTLPNSIQGLRCTNNLLTSLPTLPNSLQALGCDKNQLTSLPPLPVSLKSLNCDSNNISCFPIFPNSLDTNNFNISGNPFTCLPNYISAMNVATLAYPLCMDGDFINNPNGCYSAKGILGTIYKDNNNNCVLDATDQGHTNIHLKLFDNGNNLLAQTYSFSNGVYNFPDSAGTYTVKIDTIGMPYQVLCASPGIDSTITLTLVNPLVNNVNFDIACKPGFDIGVQSAYHTGRAFPGLQHRLNIVAGDMSYWYNLKCASGISGQVKIMVTGPVTYNGIVSGALTPSITANVFTYSIADFSTINNSSAFGLLFTTDTSAKAGDLICVNIVLTPSAGDYNPSNNNYQFCYEVSNSHDPNLKEVYPVDVQPGYQDWFTYTIHFQNTGTAPAANIRLVDTLNNNLDLETFQVINYSHYNTVTLNNRVLVFHFPNIQLTDSTSNPNGSIGFVQYRIKPKANLPLGTQIKNTANIYFDYNSPVNTNTTINTYTATASVQNLSNLNATVSIAPNPFTSETVVTFDKQQKNSIIEIMDILGKEIKMINFTGNHLIIEKGEMKAGIYFVQIIDENKNMINKKIIIQ